MDTMTYSTINSTAKPYVATRQFMAYVFSQFEKQERVKRDTGQVKLLFWLVELDTCGCPTSSKLFCTCSQRRQPASGFTGPGGAAKKKLRHCEGPIFP